MTRCERWRPRARTSCRLTNALPTPAPLHVFARFCLRTTKVADTDGDGLASSAEFSHLLHHQSYAAIPHNAKALFDFGDSQGDQDGFLTYDELLLTHGAGDEKAAQAFLGAADKNKDNKLSLPEIEAQMRAQFALLEESFTEDMKSEVKTIFGAADADASGKITREELQNGWSNGLYSDRGKAILSSAMHNSKLPKEEL